MTPLPREPAGNHPMVQTIRQLIRAVRERTILDDPSVEIKRGPTGTRIKVGRSSGGGGGTGGQAPRWG